MARDTTYVVREDMCFEPTSDSRLESRLEAIERTVFKYSYPDINGDDVVDTTEGAYILNFVTDVGAGRYSDDESGWRQFAADNGLNGDVYPDVNMDGKVDSTDTTLILNFVAGVGSGTYTNDRAGWNDYMISIFGGDDSKNGSVPKVASIASPIVPISIVGNATEEV